jgi:transaldolase
MRLFVAGPEPDELRRCAEEGLCEGVAVLGTEAMDPSPSARARLAALGGAFAGPILIEIAGFVDGFVDGSGDVAALGRALGELGPHFAARIPFAAGSAAIFEACKAAGIKTNAFACATPDEAVAAGRAGATWVSPVMTGPVAGATPGADYDLFRKTRALLKAFELGTELVVGPMGDASAVFDSSLMGAHVTLASPVVLRGIAARRG